MFKVGDIIKGTERCGGRYGVTNIKMTRGEVMHVDSENGYINVKVLEHESQPKEVGHSYDVDPKLFDLVEEEKPDPKKLERLAETRKRLEDLYNV